MNNTVTPQWVQSASDGEILDEVKKLQYLFGHSKIIRHGLDRDSEFLPTQSVSEHIYNMLTLAEYFLPLEDENSELDWLKIHKMILWHDSVELEVGDTKTHEKTEATFEAEVNAVPIVIEKSPLGLQQSVESILSEYEHRQSRESLFVKALDVLEVEIAAYTPEGKRQLRESIKADYSLMQFFKEKQHNNAKGFPSILRFVDLVMERLIEEKYYLD